MEDVLIIPDVKEVVELRARFNSDRVAPCYVILTGDGRAQLALRLDEKRVHVVTLPEGVTVESEPFEKLGRKATEIRARVVQGPDPKIPVSLAPLPDPGSARNRINIR